MSTKTIASCAECGYPLAASYEGQAATCPNCMTANIAQSVTVPSWILALGIGVIVGLVGRPWLDKQL